MIDLVGAYRPVHQGYTVIGDELSPFCIGEEGKDEAAGRRFHTVALPVNSVPILLGGASNAAHSARVDCRWRRGSMYDGRYSNDDPRCIAL